MCIELVVERIELNSVDLLSLGSSFAAGLTPGGGLLPPPATSTTPRPVQSTPAAQTTPQSKQEDWGDFSSAFE